MHYRTFISFSSSPCQDFIYLNLSLSEPREFNTVKSKNKLPRFRNASVTAAPIQSSAPLYIKQKLIKDYCTSPVTWKLGDPERTKSAQPLWCEIKFHHQDVCLPPVLPKPWEICELLENDKLQF